MEPNFQMSSLYFVVGGIQSKNKDKQNSQQFSFENCECIYIIIMNVSICSKLPSLLFIPDPDDVTKEEIKKVKEMIEYLDYCQTILTEPKILSDDDNICTICYAYPVEVTFKPCHHQTCRICIQRHLLDTRKCFFCKAIIEKVVDLSGDVLHDFSNESSNSKEIME